MPYALIPDGYSLKKVTKLQQKAVNDKRRHDNVMAFINNPNTPTLIGGAGLLALTPLLLNLVKESLEIEGITLTDAQKDNVKKAFDVALLTNPVTGPVILGKKAVDAFSDFDLSDIQKKFGRFGL